MNDHHHPQPASSKQLRYLRILAMKTGTTFTPPKNVSQASREITRLRGLLPATPDTAASERSNARREQRQVSRDLAERPRDSTAIRTHEITGYGSNARWS